MNLRNAFLALAATAALSPAAFANNFIGGELGYDTHPVAGQVTREQLQREYEAFRDHPVLSDGTVFVQGEAGYVSPNQGAFADNEPAGPHSHVLGNNGPVKAAPAALSNAERRAQQEQYLN
jgi:hypothetical protein